MVLSAFAKILLFASILLGAFPGFHSTTTLYFTNDNSIEKIQNKSATPVIQVAMAPQALDCNSCDQRIYWASKEERAIKRGNSSGGSVEVILDRDIMDPRGLAVDWRGNNVYFTDCRGPDMGRLEVITCNGQERKVLFSGLKEVGPVTVDPLHGHIYWVEFTDIWMAEMDGSNDVLLIPLDDSSHVEDMAIDYDNNFLYWTDSSKIYRAFLNGTGVTVVPDSILNNTSPSGVSVSNNVLYWTQQQSASSDGAIYSHSLLDSSDAPPDLVFTDSNLNPQDISSFIPKDITGQVTGGCSEDNGGCSDFCFIVPSSTDPFSSPSSECRCGCPTGLSFQKGSNTSCSSIPGDFLLFIQVLPDPDVVLDSCSTALANKSQISMLSFDVDSDADIPIVLPIKINAEASDLAYDLTNKRVYWTEHNPPAIKRAYINGTSKETVVSKDLLSPNMIALDSTYNTLFWTDSTLNRVEVMSVMGKIKESKRRVLATTGLQHPFGIALNEKLGVMYWTDQSINPLIQQSSLNGSVNNSFEITGKLVEPGAIAVRLATNEIYWAETAKDHWSIAQAQHNGLNFNLQYIDLDYDREISGNVAGMAVLQGSDDITEDKLYFTDRQNGRVIKADVGKAYPHFPAAIVVVEGVDNPRGIVAIHSNQEPIKKGCRFSYGMCEDICVSGQESVDTSKQCICRENYQLVGNTTCEQEHKPMLLFSNGSSVVILEKTEWQDSNTDFMQREILIPAGALDADYSDNMLYWISSVDGWVYRTDLNSNYSNPVTEPVITCCYHISDIALDWWGRNLYWIDSINGVLGVVKLNGHGLQVITRGLKNPVNLVAHPEYRSLYFIENSTNTIQSVHMDGDSSSLDVVYSFSMQIRDLALDSEKNILFWTSAENMYEYNLETQSTPLMTGFSTSSTDADGYGNGPPTLLAYYNNDIFILVRAEGIIYFLDEVQFNPLTEALELLSVYDTNQNPAYSIRDMLFVDPSTQPGVHECTTSNGECNDVDSTLCIVTGPHTHQCLCAPTKYLDVHTDIYGSSQCHDSSALLVLSTPQQILHLPLRDPPYLNSDSECSPDPPIRPRELPFGPLGNVTAVAFDPVHKSVIWYDRTTGAINRADLHGTTMTNLANVPSSSIPRSFTYDWKGGQVFLVDQLEFQIDMYTVNGVSGNILYQNPYEGDMALDEPSVVAVNSNSRKLYWADKFQLRVMQIDLDNLKVSVLPVGGRKLNILHMVVNEQNGLIYWYDNITMKLEKYNIETENISTIISSAPEHISALAATTVPVVTTESELPMLYWFNQTDHSIYWYNGSVNLLLTVDSSYKDVTGMAAFYFTNMLPTNVPCAEADRPCSHLCIPSTSPSSTPTCLCTQYLKTEPDNSCSATNCSELSFPCNGSDKCIPSTHFCDGKNHCPDGFDESNCPCSDDEFLCYSSKKCINMDKVCDGTPDCLSGEDELSCCGTIECMRAFIDGSVQCLFSDFVCDGFPDCVNGEDEQSCPDPSSLHDMPVTRSKPSSSSPSPSVLPGTSVTLNDVLLFAVPVLLLVMIVLAIGVCLYVKRLCKKGTKQLHFPENLSFQSSTSPQPSHVRSDVTSEFSIKTMETGSTHVERSSGLAGASGANIKRLSAYSTDPSNPPNSPITTRHSVACLSLASSRNYGSDFDVGVPPVPNPSVNYDAYSDRFSSVSQIRIPATIPSHSSNVPVFRRPPNNGLPPYPVPCAFNFFSPQYTQTRYLQHPGEHDTLDNISESTVSLSTFHTELVPDNTSYTVTSFYDQNGDGAPPPSPTTEFCAEGIEHDE